MKKMMTAFAAVALFGTAAVAATQPKNAVAPVKKAAKNTKKVTPAVVAAPAAPVVETVVAQPVVEVAPISATVGGGQSSVAAPAAAPVAQTKRASAKIIDRASLPMNLTNGQRDGLKSDNDQDIQASGELSIRLGYKLSDTVSVGLGTDAGHTYGALNDGKAKWVPYDVFVSASNSKLATLPGNANVKASVRLYAPTSEGSQAIGQLARLRSNITVNKEFGALNLLYSADPQYYFQRNTVSAKAGKDGSDEFTGTRNFRLLHYVGAEVTITPKWNVYSSLGLDQGWYNNDSSKQLAKNFKETSAIYAETGVGYTINDNLSLVAGVDQYDPDMLAQEAGKEGPVYRDEFTRYFLEGTVSF